MLRAARLRRAGAQAADAQSVPRRVPGLRTPPPLAADIVGLMVDAVTMDKIVSLCRRRGFVFPSSEIYGGLGSTYDYGHYGVLTKNHIRSRWLRAVVQERDDIVAIDSAGILNPAGGGGARPRAGFRDPPVHRPPRKV